MSKEHAIGGKALCALLVVFQLGFVLAAAFPGMRLCHRADGRTVLESATPFGCSCEECEHCLNRLLNPDSGRATRRAFDPCHCRHERFMPEQGSSSGLIPKREAVVPPAVFVAAAELPGPPDLAPGAAVTAFEVHAFILSSAERSPLRC